MTSEKTGTKLRGINKQNEESDYISKIFFASCDCSAATVEASLYRILSQYNTISELISFEDCQKRILELCIDGSIKDLLLAIAASDYKKRFEVNSEIALILKPIPFGTVLDSLEIIASILFKMFRSCKSEHAVTFFVDSTLSSQYTVISDFSKSAKAACHLNDIIYTKPNICDNGFAFIAHNHTSGAVYPGSADIVYQDEIVKGLEEYNISVIDSFIVTDKTVHSILFEKTVTEKKQYPLQPIILYK